MYEQYTDKQIVEMLVPKLEKAVPSVDWNMVIANAGCNWRIIQAIGLVYRSAYIRGQLGRSFIIGEKKKEIKAERGAKVCWFSNDHDTYFPNTIGTIGTISYVDFDNVLWVNWPVGSCEVHKKGKIYAETAWCCTKNQCLLIDANVKGNVKKGDKIVYLGTRGGFSCDGVWPDRVATGVVDNLECVGGGCVVRWDNPDVVGERFHGHTHVWYENIAKVIPWD